MRFGNNIIWARLTLAALLLLICIPAHGKGIAGTNRITADPESGSSASRFQEPDAVNEQAPATPSSPDKTVSVGSGGWQVITTGGLLDGASADYIHSGTIGQTATGAGSATGLILKHGFWRKFTGSGNCCDHPGDANGDGSTDVGDAVFLISHVFKGGPTPECALNGDANGDCYLNLGDAVFLVSLCFNGGAPPVCGCNQ